MRTTEPADDAVVRGRDVNIRAVFLFGLWLAAGLVAVTLAMLGLFRLLARQDRAADKPLSPIVAANLARTPPEPRLEPFPLLPGQRPCRRWATFASSTCVAARRVSPSKKC